MGPLTAVSHDVLECSAVEAAQRHICRALLSSYLVFDPQSPKDIV